MGATARRRFQGSDASRGRATNDAGHRHRRRNQRWRALQKAGVRVLSGFTERGDLRLLPLPLDLLGGTTGSDKIARDEKLARGRCALMETDCESSGGKSAPPDSGHGDGPARRIGALCPFLLRGRRSISSGFRFRELRARFTTAARSPPLVGRLLKTR
ncbi:unnamed protein product [Lampetra planeri]